MQAKVSPLAVVPSSVFAQLNSVTHALNLQSLDGSLGDATLALDVSNVNGSLGDANVYHNSDASSRPVVVNVKAVATALSILTQEIQNLGLSTTLQPLQQAISQLQATLESQPALGQYIKDVDSLTQNGSLALQTAQAHYPGGPLEQKFNVIDAAGAGSLPIVQSVSLAPYEAIASDGDTTAQHTVSASSSLDALNVLPLTSLPLGVNSSAIAQLNALISTLEAAIGPAASAAGAALPPASSVTGPVSSTLGGALGQLQGTVGTVSSSVNSVIPAGTPVSGLGTLLTQLLDLKAALAGLPSNIDLSDIVATKDVASQVTTTVTNGVVDSVATTKAADIKLLTVNAPQLVQALGVAQGSALAEIIGATATAEAKADGKTSTATGSGQFTDIKLLPGTPYAQDINFASLTGIGNTFNKVAGPLHLQILTGACACIDQAHGGTADAASAQVAALEIKLGYIGDPNLLLGTTAPAALTSPQGNEIPLADVQLANVTANAGNNVKVLSAETGSPYGVGLLVGFLMLVGALGLGITYRRFAAVKVRS